MSVRYVMQRDTKGWRVQVWASFAVAFLCGALGVWNLPAQDLDRAFLAMGMFFCLFSTLAVSKMIRDNRDGQVDTAGWTMTVWASFVASMSLTLWGLYRMKNVDEWQKYFMLVGWLYLVSSAFVLAKMLRDDQEANLLERRAAAGTSME